MKTRRVVLFVGSFVLVCASCSGKTQDYPLDADADPAVTEDVPEDDDAIPGVDTPVGCLGGIPALQVDEINLAQSDRELPEFDEPFSCSDIELFYRCKRSEWLEVFRFDPVGDGDWQILANHPDQPICCDNLFSKGIIRIDRSGSVRWMRTTCYQEGGPYQFGSDLRDSIPFAGGHLATYRVSGNGESPIPPVELRYMNEDGQILWRLSGEAIGNAKVLTPLQRDPGERAAFIADNETDRFFLSVSSLGQANLKPLPEDFGRIMTPIPDLPEEDGFPLLLIDEESDSWWFTKKITLRHLDADGNITSSKVIGTWEGKDQDSTNIWARPIGPGASGYLVGTYDNKTNIWDLIRLDAKGDRVWSYKGTIDSQDWNQGSLNFLHLLPDGRLLEISNRHDGVPYWGFLSSDGTRLELQVEGDLERPDAPAGSWGFSSAWQVGNHWLIFADMTALIYDSEFKLVHARAYYGDPESGRLQVARQGDTWYLVISHSYELGCPTGVQDANITFLKFDGVCE